MNRLAVSAERAAEAGYGQLGVLCPMSLPPYTFTYDFIDMLAEAGGDIFFIPFSTPCVRMPWMMGGTEQIVDHEAYKQGINGDMTWEVIAKVREKYPEKPIVIVSFFNDILAYGIDRFVGLCGKYGVDGLDTPGYSFVTNGDKFGFGKKLLDAGSGLIHPFSTELALAEEGTPEYEKLTAMLKAGRGFIFLMTDSAGKSGATGAMPVESMRPALRRLKMLQKELGCEVPVITVCGVATAENAAEATVEAGTDGVMLASTVIRKILAGQSLEEIGAFLHEMKLAMDISEREPSK